MIKSILIFSTIIVTMTLMSRYLLSVEQEYTKLLQYHPEQLQYTHQFKGFSLTNTNMQGKAQSVIHSPKTRVFNEQQKTIMDNPKMIMHREQEPPIVITAKYAEVLHIQNLTTLHDNVKVAMTNNNNKKVIMATEQLTLDNLTQTASTDLPATIVHDKGHMQGTGVEFNPKAKRIKLLNNVRGVYE